MELDYIERVKTLAIIAMFSDDVLMDRLVLKGGNAIDIVYKISDRASIDLDFSIKGEFKKDELPIMESKIENALKKTFSKEGYLIIDFKFIEKPKRKHQNAELYWGGYVAEFKLIEKDKYKRFSDDIEKIRRSAQVIGPNNKRVFHIDISKFEYCENKEEKELEGYVIYVYTPEMLVFEKIRAICQQMPEYQKIIKTKISTDRARDFFDIYVLMERFGIDIYSEDNKNLLRKIFDMKRVPVDFLKDLNKYKDFHREGYDSLKNTVRPGAELKEFDFYFNYVVKKFEKIKF